MTIIDQMLEQYELKTNYDRKNAIKEIIQEITLYSLAESNFFKEVAFYGKTALRIFYGLDRFSEDLDFSLTTKNENFNFSDFLPTVEKHLKSFGITVEIIEKEKTSDSNIKSAFIKGNTRTQLFTFYGQTNFSGIQNNEKIKVKFELDVNPPNYAQFETKYRLLPSPYEIKLYKPSSLFAGKIHAVVCRSWKNRVKGRDLYDYIFYITKKIPVNIKHLRERFIQTDFLNEEDELTLDKLKVILKKHFDEIDYNSAKEDVMPFIKDPSKLKIWSADFFKQITDNLLEEK